MKRSLVTAICYFCLVGVAIAKEGLIDKSESADEHGAKATGTASRVASKQLFFLEQSR